MRIRNILLATAIGTTAAVAAADPPTFTRQTYLDLAQQAYEKGVDGHRAAVKKWVDTYRPNETWGYSPPGGPVWLAGLAGALYDLAGKEEYAEQAAQLLAEQHRFKEHYPEELRKQRPEYSNGLPTLTNFFHLSPFSQAYIHIRSSPALTPERRATIERSIAESADFMLNFPEWGPMNRAMLRAEGLVLAAQALPEHPHAPTWRKLAGVLARDSWGQWEEEDAQIYHPVWLYSLMHYADAIGDRSLFDQLTVRYYFDYFLHLLAPSGMLPAFGDARWNASWPSYLACFERGASEYQRADLKWAAQRLATAMMKENGAQPGTRGGLIFTDLYRWADDELEPQEPTTGSAEALEELVGKKIVFRNGWRLDSTYLLLNYRDEGNFARMARDFLRHTIPVEEEKMHHGHSDENAICLLMDQGSVLLHDCGYRDAIPSGRYGAFRADYFHNRLVARKRKPGREQKLFDFLAYSGGYRPVETQKVEFLALADVDVSRTRVRDKLVGYESDRVIAYLKRRNIFVVFDIVKVLEPDYYTFATLWHGTTVLEEGPHHYVTAVDQIGNYEPSPERALLLNLVQQDRHRSGAFPLSCYCQDEITVYQTIASHYCAGHIETFVTVLTPHARGADVAPLLKAVELLPVEPPRAGVGVRVESDEGVEFLCIKTDLMRDILTENVRPRYTFDSGRVRYGPFETDASFLYARRSGATKAGGAGVSPATLAYAATHMVKIVYDGREIFAARPSTYALEPDDLGTGYGPPKWRCWEDTVELR